MATSSKTMDVEIDSVRRNERGRQDSKKAEGARIQSLVGYAYKQVDLLKINQTLQAPVYSSMSNDETANRR